MNDRRHSDKESEKLLDVMLAMEVAQNNMYKVLLDHLSDIKEWRQETDKKLNAHSSSLLVLKTLGAAGSAVLGFLGVDRVIGK